MPSSIACHKLSVERGQPFGRAYVVPLPAVMLALDALQGYLFAQQRRELRCGAALNGGEHLASVSGETAESEPRAIQRNPAAVQGKIASPVMTGIVDQYRVRNRPRLGKPLDGYGELCIRIIAIHIGIDRGERGGIQQRQRLGDAAGGSQCLSLARINNLDAKTRAVSQFRFDLRAEVPRG